MSLKDCINRAVKAGLMDKDRAAFARKIFDEKYDHAKLNLGNAEALAKARGDTIAAVTHMLHQSKREKILQAQVARDIIVNSKNSGVEFSRAILAHLAFDEGAVGIASVEKRKAGILSLLHSGMDEFLAKHRRDLLGRVQEKAELQDILREIHGDNTGNTSARELAQAWINTAERARLMFNKAGGDIPKPKDWGLPHSHDSVAVRRAGFDGWYAEIRPRLDINRMTDNLTGQPFTEASLKRASRSAWENIASDGRAKKGSGKNLSIDGEEFRSAGSFSGKKLSRRNRDHRFFVFKSADDWIVYHNKFGSGDVFSIMTGHLDSMSRDISMLQILGTNPTATVRWMGELIKDDLSAKAVTQRTPTDKLTSRAKKDVRLLNDMYAHYTGQVNSPIDGKFARTFAGIRNVLNSAFLGAASLAAVSDVAFSRMASQHVGIEYRKVLGRHTSLLNPRNVEDQKLAVRLGLIADHWSTIASGQQRYLGEVIGPELTRRLADFTMRVSGLSPWTQAGRWAFGMEFLGLMADNVSKAFKDLPEPLRKTFERAGINVDEWEIARATELMDEKGVKFLRPDDMADSDLALKFLDMIHTETEFAVPSASLRGSAWLRGAEKPGTIQGELIRSTAMYKSFATTLMMTQFRRVLSMPTKYQAGKYAARLALSMTLMGAFSLQLKEISKGRDPRDMIDPKFWGAAFMQGGGIGIFGDFLFSQKNRYDKGIAQTVAGPVIGLGEDIIGTVAGNVNRALEGKDTKIASDLIDLTQRYAPGSSIWYMRAAFENLLFDELRRLADPKFAQRLRRIEKRYKKDFGQEYFASRTNDSVRLPDLTAAFGR